MLLTVSTEFIYLYVIISISALLVSGTVLYFIRLRSKIAQSTPSPGSLQSNHTSTVTASFHNVINQHPHLIRAASISSVDNDYLETLSGVQQLARLAVHLPVVGSLVSALDDLTKELVRFKSRKETISVFAGRLDRVALMLTHLIESFIKNNVTFSEYDLIISELCETLVNAHKYCLEVKKASIWTWRDPKAKFDELDETISKLLGEMTIVLNLSISKKSDVTNNKLDKEQGPHRQIKNPAMKAFWCNLLNPQAQVDLPMFLEYCQDYIENDERVLEQHRLNKSGLQLHSIIDEQSIKRLVSMVKVSLTRGNGCKDGFVTVFHVNRLTKAIDPSLDFISVLYELCGPVVKIIPSLSESIKDTVWGRCEEKGPLEDAVMRSLRSEGRWTLVHGSAYVGKTHRWMVGAHSLHEDEAAIWINLKNVNSRTDLLSTITSQLSLGVGQLEQVDIAFITLIEEAFLHDPSASKSKSTKKMALVFDHVSIVNVSLIVDAMKSVIINIFKLQRTLPIAVVLITSYDEEDHLNFNANIARTQLSEEILDVRNSQSFATYSSATFPNRSNVLDVIDVPILSEPEALELAEQCNASDPLLLVRAARHLPGLIKSLHHLPQHVLQSISNDTITPTISPAATPTKSLRLFGRKRREEHIALSLSTDAKVCASCLYVPLYSNGFIFSKELAWRVCQRVMGGDMNRWLEAFDGLLAVGWIQAFGDQGFTIGKGSIKPDVAAEEYQSFQHFDDKLLWEIYFRYWVDELLAIRGMLMSRDQMLGCACFDTWRDHFGFLFQSVVDTGKYIKHSNGDVARHALQLKLELSTVIGIILDVVGCTDIHDMRLSPTFSLLVNRSILIILCSYSSSEKISDVEDIERDLITGDLSRLWSLHPENKSKIIRACIEISWSLKVTQSRQSISILQTVIATLSDTLIAKLYSDTLADHQLAVKESDLTSFDRSYDNAYGKLGNVLRISKRYHEAVIVQEKVYNVRCRIYGSTNKKSIKALFNLATARKFSQDYHGALAAINEVMEAREKTLDTMNVFMSNCYHCKASALAELSQFEESCTCFEQALQIRLAMLGEDHSRTASTHRSYADLLLKMDKKEEALDHYHHAKRIYTNLYSPTDKRVTAIAKILAASFNDSVAKNEAS